MVTQTRPTPTENNSTVRESESGPISPNRTGFHVVDLPSRFRELDKEPAAAKNRSRRARIAHLPGALYVWLSGPPTTAPERMRANLAHAEAVVRAGIW